MTPPRPLHCLHRDRQKHHAALTASVLRPHATTAGTSAPTPPAGFGAAAQTPPLSPASPGSRALGLLGPSPHLNGRTPALASGPRRQVPPLCEDSRLTRPEWPRAAASESPASGLGGDTVPEGRVTGTDSQGFTHPPWGSDAGQREGLVLEKQSPCGTWDADATQSPQAFYF